MISSGWATVSPCVSEVRLGCHRGERRQTHILRSGSHFFDLRHNPVSDFISYPTVQNSRREIIMRQKATVLLSAIALGLVGFIGTGSPAIADTSAVTTAAEKAPGSRVSDPVETMASRSFSCEWEPGDINFSWSTGTTNTRIYVNNHCSAVRYFTVALADAAGGWNVCWRVPVGKSNKEFSHGLTGSVKSILRHC